jgi:hypothetical protein
MKKLNRVLVLLVICLITYSCETNETYKTKSQKSFEKYRQFYDTIPEHNVYSLNRKQIVI